MSTANNVRKNLRNYLAGHGFIKLRDFTTTFLLSAIADIPIIYWGEGGYGKTELVRAAFSFFGVVVLPKKPIIPNQR